MRLKHRINPISGHKIRKNARGKNLYKIITFMFIASQCNTAHKHAQYDDTYNAYIVEFVIFDTTTYTDCVTCNGNYVYLFLLIQGFQQPFSLFPPFSRLFCYILYKFIFFFYYYFTLNHIIFLSFPFSLRHIRYREENGARSMPRRSRRDD